MSKKSIMLILQMKIEEKNNNKKNKNLKFYVPIQIIPLVSTVRREFKFLKSFRNPMLP